MVIDTERVTHYELHTSGLSAMAWKKGDTILWYMNKCGNGSIGDFADLVDYLKRDAVCDCGTFYNHNL